MHLVRAASGDDEHLVKTDDGDDVNDVWDLLGPTIQPTW